jgi:integrase
MPEGINRRCGCRYSGTRKRLGAACPHRAKRNHGSYWIQAELPEDSDGKRQFFRRYGYATATAAGKDLDTLKALLTIPAPDDRKRQIVLAEVLLNIQRGRQPLPDYDTLKKRMAGRKRASERLTVADWLDIWHSRRNKRSNTMRNDASNIRLYLKPHIGAVWLDELDVDHLIDMVDAIDDDASDQEAHNVRRRAIDAQLKEIPYRPHQYRAERNALKVERLQLRPWKNPVGATAKRLLIATLRKALNDAIAEPGQAITFNPAAHLDLGELPQSIPMLWTDARVAEWQDTGLKPSRVMLWTLPQVTRFLDSDEVHDHRLSALWQLLLYQGLRRAEACGQQLNDVDLIDQSMKIWVQRTHDGDGWVDSAVKSKAGERTIWMSDELTSIVAIHMARRNQEKLEARGTWTESGKLFVRGDGTPVNPDWVSHEFRRLCARIGLPPIRVHDLRHVSATLMLQAKVDIKVVSHNHGHAHTSITRDLYQTVSREMAMEAAIAMAAIIPRNRRKGDASVV